MEERYEAAAAAIAGSIVALGTQQAPELHPVDPAEVSRDQRRFVASATRALAPHGFRVLADTEPVGVTPPLSRRTLMRVLTDTEGTVTASLYSVQARVVGSRAIRLLQHLALQPLRSRSRTVEMETAWSDGRFVVTHNAGHLPQFLAGPTVDPEALPRASTPGTVALRHASRVAAYAAVHPGVEALRVPDLDTINRLARIQVAAKSEFRRSIGHLDEDELRSVLGKHHDLLADRVRRHVHRLREEQAAAPADQQT